MTIGGLPRLFTTVSISIVTISVTARVPRSTTTVYGAGPTPIAGVTVIVPAFPPLWYIDVTLTTANIAGKGSVTTTFGAGVLPWLVTVIVNITVSPTDARKGSPVLDKAGSII